jgi:hypothetical protein
MYLDRSHPFQAQALCRACSVRDVLCAMFCVQCLRAIFVRDVLHAMFCAVVCLLRRTRSAVDCQSCRKSCVAMLAMLCWPTRIQGALKLVLSQPCDEG